MKGKGSYQDKFQDLVFPMGNSRPTVQ